MSKRNKNRPGYKKTKVGWIPKEWESGQLQSLGALGPLENLLNLYHALFLSPKSHTCRLVSEVMAGAPSIRLSYCRKKS